MKSLNDQTEEELQVTMLEVAKAVKEKLPYDTGFIILATPFGTEGQAQYVANGQREDCIQWLEETADRLRRRDTNERNRYG
jgi:hypothetical protein